MEFPFATIATAQAGGKVFVLQDVSSPIENPVRNFHAYSLEGVLLWTAENPINGPCSFFNGIMSTEPLKAYNYAGFICTFDPETGQVLNSEFTK